MAIVKQQEADKRPVAKNSFTMACHTSLRAGYCHTGEHILELKENLYHCHRKLLKKVVGHVVTIRFSRLNSR